MENMDNYIKINKKIWDNPINKKPNYLAIWMYLLSNASHKNKKVIKNNKKIVIKRGEFIGSSVKISNYFNISKTSVNNILKYFVLNNKINIKTTNKYTLFSINNYGLYNFTDIKPKIKINKQFGNPLINDFINILTKFTGLNSLDGSQKENRNYAHLFINNKLKPEFKSRTGAVATNTELINSLKAIINKTNGWHKNKITNFKYLYYNFGVILKEINKSQITIIG